MIFFGEYLIASGSEVIISLFGRNRFLQCLQPFFSYKNTPLSVTFIRIFKFSTLPDGLKARNIFPDEKRSAYIFIFARKPI